MLELLDRPTFEAHFAKLPEDTSLSLALIDLDNFKSINDDFGYEAGDAVLRALETLLLSNLLPDALVGRLGGDEYAAALPETPAESALILLEEIRSHFSSRAAVPSVPRKLNLSVGIANRPSHAKTQTELFRASAEALYRSKTEGRGRVAIFVESKMTLKSNYYPKASLEKLSKLSAALSRTEASLLREALDDLFIRHGEAL